MVGRFAMLALVALAALLYAHSEQVRNGKFSGLHATPAEIAKFDEHVQGLRNRGWTCPEAKEWPWGWGGQGDGVTIAWPATGGVDNDRHGRISGGINGYVNGYWGQPFSGNQILTFRARGKGTLRVGLMAYKLSDDHQQILPGGSMPLFTIRVNSPEWVRYRYLMKKPDYELTGHPLFQAQDGVIDFDNVDMLDADPALNLMVAEENALYGTGALLENLQFATADATFRERVAAYTAAVKAWRARAEALDPALVKSLEEAVAALDLYVLTPGVQIVTADRYNDMVLLTRVLQKLAGSTAQAAQPLTASAAAPVTDAPGLYPGRRDPRPDTVTITNIRSNKVRYVEDEAATTTATLVSTKAVVVSGRVKARMILDLDTVRDLAGGIVTLAPGEKKTWAFSYPVGPETYGRAIEVAFIDNDGAVLDRWQEYYAVAAEFFRVHQHSFNTETKYWPADPFIFYFNQSHYFSAEPTDFGIEPFAAEIYKSGQAGYQMNAPARRGQIAYNKQVGIATSVYVTNDFCGQMGYEQARQYPEFVLYSANGQWAEDAVYGGYPNPMEIASPLEIGPKRKELSIKPYLDRVYTPWQHALVNMANEDAVVWGLERIKNYAEAWGFDGVYWDGCLGVWGGYGYDGVRNVPSGKYEDYVALGARNHRLWNQILKRDNPQFGTWLNWGLEGAAGEWARSQGITIWLGSGVGGDDPLDDNIRAATEGKNIMLLDEHANLSGYDYRALLESRIESRDHYVQKYGANHIIGYVTPAVDIQEPGPTKWGWPTWNHVLAQLIATQSHFASFFVPSYRPSFQFMARYSRFIWAPDIKTVPEYEVNKTVIVTSPEEVWWKPLVYKRQTDHGYDLIVHLVRIPATKTVDLTWADEPQPLAGTTISVDLGDATLERAMACRPYHFEEEQQTVEQIVTPDIRTGKITVAVPPFRYHTMLVVRVRN